MSALPRRLLAVFGAIVILAGLLISGAGRPADVFGAGGPSNGLDHFGITVPASATAGASYDIIVTALDRRERVLTGYVGPATLSGSALLASPNGTVQAPSANLSWADGVGTASVRSYRSQAAAIITVTGTVSSNSLPFQVLPAAASALQFADGLNAFNGQPVDTKVNTSSLHTSISSSLTDSSVPIKVLATDTYGNRVGGVNVTIDDDDAAVPMGGTKSATTASGTPGVETYGEASFGTLSLDVLGTYSLLATSGALSATSDEFEIVADLALCDESPCKNTGKFNNGTTPQTTYGTASGDFDNNVVLTTSFIDLDTGVEYCAGDDLTFGETTEVRVQDAEAGGVTAAEPDFSVALLYPRATLQYLDITSRGVPSFQVCLGATRLDPAAPIWQAKTSADDATLINATLIDGAYWGWVPDCAAVTTLPGNPCIVVRTKDASVLQAALGLNNADFKKLGFKSGDLALVVSKPWPWDGKFTAR